MKTEREMSDWLDTHPYEFSVQSHKMYSEDCLFILFRDYNYYFSVQGEIFSDSLKDILDHANKEITLWIKNNDETWDIIRSQSASILMNIIHDQFLNTIAKALEKYPNNEGLHTARFEIALSKPVIASDRKKHNVR